MSGNRSDLHDLRVRITAKDQLLAGGNGQILERLAAIAIVAIVERVHGRKILRPVSEHVPEDGQALGGSVWQGPEQHAVHHAEEGGTGTDAESERRDGQSQEALAARQRSECESKVLNHGRLQRCIDVAARDARRAPGRSTLFPPLTHHPEVCIRLDEELPLRNSDGGQAVRGARIVERIRRQDLELRPGSKDRCDAGGFTRDVDLAVREHG